MTTWLSKHRLKQDNADLRARLDRATTELTTARADLDTRGWNRRSAERIATDLITRTGEVAATKAALRDTETQLGQARQRIASLTTGRSATRATAWQNAGRRAREFADARDGAIKERSTTA